MNICLLLTLFQTACKRAIYETHPLLPPPYVSLAAMLITVAVIVLSTLATHAPAQNQTWLTLKNIRTDKATAFYADNHTDRGLVCGDGPSNRRLR